MLNFHDTPKTETLQLIDALLEGAIYHMDQLQSDSAWGEDEIIWDNGNFLTVAVEVYESSVTYSFYDGFNYLEKKHINEARTVLETVLQ